MARLLVVHHTPSPAMQELLEAALAGAGDPELAEAGVEVVVRPALVASAVETMEADGYLLATPANIMSDTGALLDYLAAQHDVKPGGIGTTGYCMGGLMSLTAAGTYPDRIVAAASYHGGRLATDAPDSPHLLAPRIKARVYVAGAIEDQSFPDDMKARLEAALTKAGIDHKIETYQAKHGWVFRDTPVYDATAAERHWQTMLALFHAKL